MSIPYSDRLDAFELIPKLLLQSSRRKVPSTGAAGDLADFESRIFRLARTASSFLHLTRIYWQRAPRCSCVFALAERSANFMPLRDGYNLNSKPEAEAHHVSSVPSFALHLRSPRTPSADPAPPQKSLATLNPSSRFRNRSKPLRKGTLYSLIRRCGVANCGVV